MDLNKYLKQAKNQEENVVAEYLKMHGIEIEIKNHLGKTEYHLTKDGIKKPVLVREFVIDGLKGELKYSIKEEQEL